MGQLGFFDTDKRLAALSAKGDPLEAIDRLMPWESFREDIEAVVQTREAERKSAAGRKPIDAIVLFRMLILQSLYNLSDEQVEYQVRDRLSFTRFLSCGIEDCIPDGTMLWLFREKLAQAGVIEKLVDRFDRRLGANGYVARGGQIVDATIVAVPRQRNTREENETVKSGRTPAAWEKRPAKNRQKDKDARWTKKHGRSFYGYKNHVNADAKHKLIRRYDVSDAAVHDSHNRSVPRMFCASVPIGEDYVTTLVVDKKPPPELFSGTLDQADQLTKQPSTAEQPRAISFIREPFTIVRLPIASSLAAILVWFFG